MVHSFLTAEEKLFFKNKCKLACLAILEQRITTTQSSIDAAQQQANQEEKSSAGDKYETSRAMGHLEKDMQSRQLAAHIKELASLHAVNINQLYYTPVAGALVICSGVTFFIACGLGKQRVEDSSIIFVSSQAPVAQSMLLKQAGDSFLFNGRAITIEEIY